MGASETALSEAAMAGRKSNEERAPSMPMKKSQHQGGNDRAAGGDSSPGRRTTGPRGPATLPSGKVRLSADIRSDLYRKLRVHIALTNSRINKFVEDMIEKEC